MKKKKRRNDDRPNLCKSWYLAQLTVLIIKSYGRTYLLCLICLNIDVDCAWIIGTWVWLCLWCLSCMEIVDYTHICYRDRTITLVQSSYYYLLSGAKEKNWNIIFIRLFLFLFLQFFAHVFVKVEHSYMHSNLFSRIQTNRMNYAIMAIVMCAPCMMPWTWHYSLLNQVLEKSNNVHDLLKQMILTFKLLEPGFSVKMDVSVFACTQHHTKLCQKSNLSTSSL